jgi:2-alkenal reductase
VLQVGGANLPAIPLGDSSKLQLGETVVAIGNPLSEFSGTVTAGVVSGLNRIRTFDGVIQDDLIQTDAAINSGNSGGALLNLQGQLVGIPTAILRQSRGGASVEGIAFALPINRGMDIARGIISGNGNYPRPSLGLDAQDITPDVLSRLPRLGVDHGALVTAVAVAGPGSQAGIVAGDVITRVGDRDVNTDRLFLNTLTGLKPGDDVKVVLNRNGRIIEVDVKLGKRT